MQPNDTIAAPATPPGHGAVSLLRISGPQAWAVAARVFRASDPAGGSFAPGRVRRGRVEHAGRMIDEVLLTAFRGPKSYTGEDVVEISGHGGMVVSRLVLQAVLEAGARPADPGEFTQRAFLNGKMDLTQAESVMDLICARSEASARAAAAQLEGRLGRRVEELREGVVTALAHLEAFIDFPEEGIDPESGRALADRFKALAAGIDELLQTADEGRMLREGVRLVIHGEPNAGKSSLLNLLLGHDRAMVSDIPGTTRDTVEENMTLRGIPFRVVDTAGIRPSDDPLEVEGMRRAKVQVEKADVTVLVMDAATAVPEEPPRPGEIRVWNKIDLRPEVTPPAGCLPLCCLDGRGVDDLVGAIAGAAGGLAVHRGDGIVAINARHQHCLTRAAGFVAEAASSLERRDPPEITAIELRAALAAIGEITGGADHEEVLDKIFGTFCIGK